MSSNRHPYIAAPEEEIAKQHSQHETRKKSKKLKVNKRKGKSSQKNGPMRISSPVSEYFLQSTAEHQLFFDGRNHGNHQHIHEKSAPAIRLKKHIGKVFHHLLLRSHPGLQPIQERRQFQKLVQLPGQLNDGRRNKAQSKRK